MRYFLLFAFPFSVSAFLVQLHPFASKISLNKEKCFNVIASTIRNRQTRVDATIVLDPTNSTNDFPDTSRTMSAPDGSKRPVVELKRYVTSPVNLHNKKPRVLFLHGEYTNERIAEYTLKLSRWDKLFDFIIPGATNKGCAAPPDVFNSLGLDALVKVGRYRDDDQFWTWGCRYDLMKSKASEIPKSMKECFQRKTADYMKRIDEEYGPFDGVMGFCEGGAALNCVLGMKEDKKLEGVFDSVNFFIHIAPWSTPLAGKYQFFEKSIPTKSIYGSNDPNDGFPEAYAKYPSGFRGYFDEHVHEGEHNYAYVSSDLLLKVTKLLESLQEMNENDITPSSLDDTDARVINVIQEVLKQEAMVQETVAPVPKVTKRSALVDDLVMDSIFWQEMNLSLEEEFNIVFDTSTEERLLETNNIVQDIIDIVKENIESKD